MTPGGGGNKINDRQRADFIARKFENAGLEVLEIHDEDLRPFIVNIYKTDLGCLQSLKSLSFVRC